MKHDCIRLKLDYYLVVAMCQKPTDLLVISPP